MRVIIDLLKSILDKVKTISEGGGGGGSSWDLVFSISTAGPEAGTTATLTSGTFAAAAAKIRAGEHCTAVMTGYNDAISMGGTYVFTSISLTVDDPYNPENPYIICGYKGPESNVYSMVVLTDNDVFFEYDA